MIKNTDGIQSLGELCVVRMNGRSRSNQFKEPLLFNFSNPDPNYKILFSSNLRFTT